MRSKCEHTVRVRPTSKYFDSENEDDEGDDNFALIENVVVHSISI